MSVLVRTGGDFCVLRKHFCELRHDFGVLALLDVGDGAGEDDNEPEDDAEVELWGG